MSFTGIGISHDTINKTINEIIIKNKKREKLYTPLLINQKIYQQSYQCDIDLTYAVEVSLDNMTALEFVGVQPISSPIGVIYYLHHIHEDETEKEGLIRLGRVSKIIEAKTLPLAVNINVEAVQEAQVTNKKILQHDVGKKVATEYNQEIVNDLHNLARLSETVITSNEQLVDLIRRAANTIARETRRGRGNWLVTSKEIIKRLKPHISPNNGVFVDLDNEKELAKLPDVFEYGILNGEIVVYVNQFHFDNSILIGYKGSTSCDTGYVMAPFQLLISGEVITNPDTFQPALSLMTRYGKSIAKNAKDYYTRLDLIFRDSNKW